MRSLADSEHSWERHFRRDFGEDLVGGLLASFSPEQWRRLSWKRLYEEISCLRSLSCCRIKIRDGVFPPVRHSHSLNFVSDCLVLLGGGSETGQILDDTWVAYIGSGFPGVVGWQNVSSGTPSSRYGHSCTVVSDTLVLFGGKTVNAVSLNDTWIGQVIDQGSLEVKISWRPLDVGPIAPPPRMWHAACCVGSKRIAISGGWLRGEIYQDGIWLLDISEDFTSGRWSQMAKDCPQPPARAGHSMTWIGENHVLVFGGLGDDELLNDLWFFDIGEEHPKWVELKYDSSNTRGEIPLPRTGHSATLSVGGRVLIYGCDGSESGLNDDFWILDLSALSRFQTIRLRGPPGKMWKKLKIQDNCLNDRSFHGACTDKSGRYVFFYGGDVVRPPAKGHRSRFDGNLYLVDLVPQFWKIYNWSWNL